jgi:peptidoglycan hydrolase CwlO-like protein
MNTEFLLIISNVVTAFVGWFIGRKRQQAETDNQTLRNLELSIDLYREIIQDLKKEIEDLNKKVQELETKIDELHKENIRLRSSI